MKLTTVRSRAVFSGEEIHEFSFAKQECYRWRRGIALFGELLSIWVYILIYLCTSCMTLKTYLNPLSLNLTHLRSLLQGSGESQWGNTGRAPGWLLALQKLVNGSGGDWWWRGDCSHHDRRRWLVAEPLELARLGSGLRSNLRQGK